VRRLLDGGIIACFGFAQQGLYVGTQGLGLGQGSLDSFVQNQRRGHVGQHRFAVRCSSVQVIDFISVSHFL